MNTREPVYYLVGMMGVGKSTVGVALAEALGVPFIDSDAEIERRAGRSIPAIFDSEGEAAFRALEREVIRSMGAARAVVSLGGGALTAPETLERLEASGGLIYLEAPVSTLLSRIGDPESRPLLAGLSDKEREDKLSELLRARAEQYARAHYRVDASGSPADTTRRILEATQADRPTEAPDGTDAGTPRSSASIETRAAASSGPLKGTSH